MHVGVSQARLLRQHPTTFQPHLQTKTGKCAKCSVCTVAFSFTASRLKKGCSWAHFTGAKLRLRKVKPAAQSHTVNGRRELGCKHRPMNPWLPSSHYPDTCPKKQASPREAALEAWVIQVGQGSQIVSWSWNSWTPSPG